MLCRHCCLSVRPVPVPVPDQATAVVATVVTVAPTVVAVVDSVYCCCCYYWCCYRPWLHIFLSYSTLIMVFRLVTKRCSQPQSPHLSLSLPLPVYCHPLDFLMKLLPCNWGRAGSTGTFNRHPVADAEVLALPAYQNPRERERLDPIQVIYCTQT